MGGRETSKHNNTEGLSAVDGAKAYRQGLKLCGEGFYDKALPLFDRAIALRGNCSHYFAARANCKQALGQQVDAYHDYVSAIRLNHTKSTYFSCRGLCLMKMGKVEAALSDFGKACELEPTAAVYHYQRASLLHHQLSRPAEAVLSYAECLAHVGPGDTAMTLRCLHAKGACLFEEGRAVEAVADLSQAVEMSDASPPALHYLAKALMSVGKEGRALAVLGEALQKWDSVVPEGKEGGSSSNNKHEVFFDRGVLRMNLGDDVGALSDFDEAVGLSRGERGGYFVQRARALARVAMRSQGGEEALAGVKDIEKAMELEPENEEFLFTAGVLCSRMGEYDRALGHLQSLVALMKEQETHSGRGAQQGCGGSGGAEGKQQSLSDGAKSTANNGRTPVVSRAECEFETALCLYKLGRPLESLPLAESALTSCCSEDAKRFQLRGLVLHDLKRYGDAIKDFTASIAVKGQRPEGFLLRGRSQAGLGRHVAAVDDFTTALSLLLHPKDKELACSRDGTVASDEKEEPAGGEICAAAATAAADGDGEVGIIPGSENKQEEADKKDTADGSVRTTPDGDQEGTRADGGGHRRVSRTSDGGDGMGEGASVVGACHYARALSLQQLGRYAEAVLDFDTAIQEGPVNWQRLWHRATCLAELDESFRRSAARDLRACLSMAEEEGAPEMCNFLFQVGLAFLRLRDSATALRHFDRANEELLRDPYGARESTSSRKFRNRETVDRGEQKLSRERPSMKGNVKLASPAGTGEGFEALLHYHRGVCLVKAGELHEAEEAFSKAIGGRKQAAAPVVNGRKLTIEGTKNNSSEDMRAAFYRERGMVRQLLRDFSGARSDFTACLPEVKSPHGSPGRASHSDSIEIDPSPHNVRVLFRRAWASKALGDLSQAAADFESARLLEPAHPHFSVDYRNIFDTELVVVEDLDPVTQAPAVFHSW